MYADPVTVNGTPLSASDLVARARVMQAALAEPEREVLAVVESADAVAVAFRLAGRHVGALDTPAGRLPASGARIDLRVIDVLSIAEGRISAVWMVGDWLGALAPAGMVQVQTSPVSEGPTGAI
jgi:predicted ester cyclase